MATIKKTGLTDDQADIIRQTLPVVGANIGDITPNFYRRMFTAHPSCWPMFNRGNQKQGARRRRWPRRWPPRRDPSIPTPRPRAARPHRPKHLATGIVEEQYPIVHKTCSTPSRRS